MVGKLHMSGLWDKRQHTVQRVSQFILHFLVEQWYTIRSYLCWYLTRYTLHFRTSYSRCCVFFAVTMTSTPLGRFSTKYWSVAKLTLMARHWCWVKRPGTLGRHLAFQFLLKVFNRANTGLCTGLWISFTATLAKHVFIKPALCSGALSCWSKFWTFWFQWRENVMPSEDYGNAEVRSECLDCFKLTRRQG